MSYKRYLPALLVCLLSVLFFLPAILQGKILLPADTIVGLYHPYRDLYQKDYPNGIPFKNFLITDPVRQQYPWKHESIQEMKQWSVPTWNPYTFAGTPLLANIQSAAFYPANLLFFLLPFANAWNIYILLQLLLGAVFMYLYLKELKLSFPAAVLGSFLFAYSGFSIAWLEWGNIGHTALWLPLILLSIDKISNVKYPMSNVQLKNGEMVRWSLVFVVALACSFFAGHWQTFFYVFLTSNAYLAFRWFQYGKRLKTLIPFAISYLLFALLTIFQWYPSLLFILESARNLDQLDWQKAGWFIPWQNSIQFIAPDFFGNPATLNYFGIWNYAEFVGYIGIAPLILAGYGVLRRDRNTLFYLSLLIISLLFAFPTVLAKIPFLLSLPFISTAQPTRLLVLVDFALAILAAFGLEQVIHEKKKSIFIPIVCLGSIIVLLWIVLYTAPHLVSQLPENISVAMRNLRLPTLLFFASIIVLLGMQYVTVKKLRHALVIGLLLLCIFDLFRFTMKFTPVTDPSYLYPASSTISFLKQHLENQRYMSLDSRILPPNFSLMYHLQTVEGYDPLYLRRYGELMTASERKKADIEPPFSFNRIITPHEVTPITNLLGVKYVLTLTDITDQHLKKVHQEGETRVYENTAALPRAFLVQQVTTVPEGDKQSAIAFLFDSQKDLRAEAVVEAPHSSLRESYATGSAVIQSYYPNLVSIKTVSDGEGFLVLTDTYYPTWKAHLITDAKTIQEIPIYRTNFNFRGIVVPAGEHIIEFTNSLF